MDYHFEEDLTLATDQLEVLVRAQARTGQVEHLLNYLAAYTEERPKVLAVKTSERIDLVKVEQILSVEVEGDYLRLTLLTGSLLTRERLYKFVERINNPDFVQISRYGLVNINHLHYLEDSFSGNMTAHLSGKHKVTVSRRYLKALSQRLGL